MRYALTAIVGAIVLLCANFQPALALTPAEAIQAICADESVDCDTIFEQKIYQQVPVTIDFTSGFEGCAADPCGPDCPSAPWSRCVAQTELNPDMLECLEAPSRCFLVGDDEVLPWPWRISGVVSGVNTFGVPLIGDMRQNIQPIRDWGNLGNQTAPLAPNGEGGSAGGSAILLVLPGGDWRPPHEDSGYVARLIPNGEGGSAGGPAGYVIDEADLGHFPPWMWPYIRTADMAGLLAAMPEDDRRTLGMSDLDISGDTGYVVDEEELKKIPPGLRPYVREGDIYGLFAAIEDATRLKIGVADFAKIEASAIEGGVLEGVDAIGNGVIEIDMGALQNALNNQGISLGQSMVFAAPVARQGAVGLVGPDEDPEDFPIWLRPVIIVLPGGTSAR